MSLERLAAARSALASRLQLAEMERQREAQRLQAFQNVGMQGISALNTGIGAIAGGIQADADRKSRAQEILEGQQFQAGQKELDRKHQMAMLERRLELQAQAKANQPQSRSEIRKSLDSYLRRAGDQGALAKDTEDLIMARALAGEGGGTGDLGIRERAARTAMGDIPHADELGRTEVMSVLESSEASLAKERAARAKELALPQQPEARMKMMEDHRDILATQKRLGERASSKTLQWDKMNKILPSFMKRFAPDSPAQTVGGGASFGGGIIIASLDGSFTLTQSRGNFSNKALADAKTELDKLNTLNEETRNFLIQLARTDRQLAAAQERLTDQDWQFYEVNGLYKAAMTSPSAFADMLNSMHEQTYQRYSDRVKDDQGRYQVGGSLIDGLDLYREVLPKGFGGAAPTAPPAMVPDGKGGERPMVLTDIYDEQKDIQNLEDRSRTTTGIVKRGGKEVTEEALITSLRALGIKDQVVGEDGTLDIDAAEIAVKALGGLNPEAGKAAKWLLDSYRDLRRHDPAKTMQQSLDELQAETKERRNEDGFGVPHEKRAKASTFLRDLASRPGVDPGRKERLLEAARAALEDRLDPAQVERIIESSADLPPRTETARPPAATPAPKAITPAAPTDANPTAGAAARARNAALGLDKEKIPEGAEFTLEMDEAGATVKNETAARAAGRQTLGDRLGLAATEALTPSEETKESLKRSARGGLTGAVGAIQMAPHALETAKNAILEGLGLSGSEAGPSPLAESPERTFAEHAVSHALKTYKPGSAGYKAILGHDGLVDRVLNGPPMKDWEWQEYYQQIGFAGADSKGRPVRSVMPQGSYQPGDERL